ncbi:MAG: hypothetical protein GTO33_08065 [Acidobacteria bacterium]|nr:hypothetical protein [Acidobacteriota bacterium]
MPSTDVPPQDSVESAPATTRELLDSIREDLVELRFEKALAALAPLVTSPVLTEEERVEAMVLRSQTHAALGDFKSAEEDYRQILMRRPGWVPDRSLTPKKAMDRFEKVRDALIGRVRFALDPADATLWIDGREQVDTLEPLPLLAGRHTIRAARRGHDPVEQTLEVAAGENIELSIELIPNARTVILRTEPEDVEVWLDGRSVGRTARVEEFLGLGQAPAQLVLEDVPLGEHTFEFRAECRRAEKIVDALNIDLLDRAPKRYDTVRLAESYVLLTPVGGPGGAEFRVDGRTVATLPTETVQACPGERELQAVFADRVLWSERRTLVEGVPQTLEIRARPNLALVGLDRLPRELEALAATVNVFPLDADSNADFSQDSTWNALDTVQPFDLALAPDPDSPRRAAQSWWLYSPVLHSLDHLEGVPGVEKPEWRTATWGLTLVDAGGPLVVESLDSTPGRPDVGSRVLKAAGVPVADVSALREQLTAAAAQGAIELEWTKPDGGTATGRVLATVGPWLRELGPRGIDDAFRAAWAVVAADSQASDAPAALANLALVFSARGEHALAVRTWQRVDWPERDGIGAGTVAYYLGRELQALGRDEEAVEALRRAASSRARTGTDDGPPVAPAARDRLADLGQR